MKRKKSSVPPVRTTLRPAIEPKPVPAAASREPAPEPRFMPPVALSYESTLDLKPIPATERTQSPAGGPARTRRRPVRRQTKR